jgi:HD superfamily phosphodiesterase
MDDPMSETILQQARQFLIESLRGKEVVYETIHPWRKSWQFNVLHSFRVEAYAQQILADEGNPLSDENVTLVRLAAILHDISRVDGTPQHAERSAAIIRKWLEMNPPLAKQIGDVEKLIELIETHSEKDFHDNDVRRAVLKDADLLDETGAMSILMAISWLDRASPFFPYHLLERLATTEIQSCDEQIKQLNTASARKLLAQRREFIQSFITQLSAEMRGCFTTFERLNVETSESSPVPTQ